MANEPDESVVPASFSKALTVTVCGDPEAELYVWLGVESDVAVVSSPSPQVMVYLVLAPAVGVVVMVKVTVSPRLIEVESDTNETDFRYVPACTLPSTSFNSSIASVTDVPDAKPR